MILTKFNIPPDSLAVDNSLEIISAMVDASGEDESPGVPCSLFLSLFMISSGVFFFFLLLSVGGTIGAVITFDTTEKGKLTWSGLHRRR